jgi:transcription elongation factor Elf1
MANSIWTTEQFACPGCGADYTATKEEQPTKRAGSFNCSICGAEVHAWSGYHDFFDWKAAKARFATFSKKVPAS